MAETFNINDFLRAKLVGSVLVNSKYSSDDQHDWKGKVIEDIEICINESREDAVLYIDYKDDDGNRQHAEFYFSDTLELG